MGQSKKRIDRKLDIQTKVGLVMIILGFSVLIFVLTTIGY